MKDNYDNYIPHYNIPKFGDSTYTKFGYYSTNIDKPYPKVPKLKRILSKAGKSKKIITLPSLKED